MRDAVTRSGIDVTIVGVDRSGRIDAAAVAAAARAKLRWSACSWRTTRSAPCNRRRKSATGCASDATLVHVDACTAAGHVDVDFAALGADLCSVTAHKFGGPLGRGGVAGAAGVAHRATAGRSGRKSGPRRGGIENVPRGSASAPRARRSISRVSRRRSVGRSIGPQPLLDLVPEVERFGDGSLPNLLCLGIGGVEAEPILLALDQKGVAVHSGSACSSETLRTVAGAGSDGSRRRSITARLGRLVVDERRRRTLCGSVPGNRRTPRGLRAV